MTTEIWIDSEYLKEIWNQLDTDKFTVRAEFDEETKEEIKQHFREIAILKQKTDANKKTE